MKKLPKTVYVRWENGDTPDEFLLSAEDPSEFATFGEKVVAGVYVLQEKVEIETKIEVTSKENKS